jgi:serine/threonine protein kinase/Tol biopolymer transport system component
MPTLERWHRIEEIFHDALQRGIAERESYLRHACGGDSLLFREVSSLLENHPSAGDEDGAAPWAAVVAARLAAEQVSLKLGSCLGPYRVEAFLAAGGMGEVYRATDTRLNRDVAIKISAAKFGERFEREARIIASLNHPNICRLYDVGPNYLVMELLEGASLADRLGRGALPVPEALGLALQIAEALEAAHEKGRIHCDLKPRNIQVTPEGMVKLLDFGLAEAAGESSAESCGCAAAPRAIFGTPEYMSPEQKLGAPLDKRTDIWAFGAVLFEMLTGKRPFERDPRPGDIQPAPDLSALPSVTPPRIRHLLARCLEPDRRQRLRDIGEARIAIAAPDDAPAPSWSRQRLSWLLAGAFAMALIAIAVSWRRAALESPPQPAMRLSIDTGADTPLTTSGFQSAFAVSPDGRRLVYTARGSDGVTRLALRLLGENRSTFLAGTDNAQGPFFSPDSEWIGFFADENLEKISVHGGAPVRLCHAPGPRGASWGDDGSIVASLSLGNGGLSRIPATGGVPVSLEADHGKGAIHRWPQVLPGSRAVLFTSYRLSGDSEEASIEVLSLDRGERKTLERGYFGRYLPDGHLLLVRGATLFAAPLDLRRMALAATPKPVLLDVSGPAYSGARNFDFSNNGTFFYLSGSVGNNQVISLLNENGEVRPLRVVAGQYLQPRFSPDGKQLAFTVASGHGADIWMQDLERGEEWRRTLLPGRNWWPLWTPDGQRIVFSSGNQGRHDLYSVRADGSGDPELLAGGDVQGIPRSFSPDGKFLAFDRAAGNQSGTEIWTAPLEGGPEHPRLGPAVRFADASTPVPEVQFSPDGRWIAYVSATLGATDVFVRPFHQPGGTRKISTGGGRFPVWSRNGRDLLFLGPDQRLRVISYSAAGSSFSPGAPRLWSNLQIADLGVNASYDVAPDGKRVAAILNPDPAGANSAPRLTVVVHFSNELRRQFRPPEQ